MKDLNQIYCNNCNKMSNCINKTELIIVGKSYKKKTLFIIKKQVLHFMSL